MKTVALIQARTGSTRLPGKVLRNIGNSPMLLTVIKRLRRAARIDQITVATSTSKVDDPIEQLCLTHHTTCCRGSEEDVLGRFYYAAQSSQADIVVRITADCPLIDPQVVDCVIETFLEHPAADYASNIFPERTYPRGLDTEVISFSTLELIHRLDVNPDWREHVTPYIHRNPHLFRICTLTCDQDHSALRWTVDTPEDLCVVQEIYNHFGTDDFTWQEALDVYGANPAWAEINRNILQKTVA